MAVLYPPICPVCGKLNPDYEDRVCDKCISKLPYIIGNRCAICSKQIEEDSRHCNDCESVNHHFIRGFSLWQYNNISKKLMTGIKYQSRRCYAPFMAAELIYHAQIYIKKWQADAIIPVPLHIGKYRKRGYNQAEIIANEIAALANIPVINDVLFRKRNTRAQKHFGKEKRRKNLEGAFYADEKKLKMYVDEKNIKRVIIVDDIYTTGSTINACAKILRQTGIESYFITMCIGDGF